MFFLDTELKIRWFSPEAAKIINFTELDIGKSISEITTQLSYRNFKHDTSQVLKRMQSFEIEVTVKTGAWYLMKMVPYKNTESTNEGVVINLFDITRYKSAEAERQQTQERLNDAQELGRIGSWEWNLKSNALIWSDEVYKIFGVKPHAFMPAVESFEATIHPEDRESFLQQREQMLAEKNEACIDHRILLPDKSVGYVQERTKLIRDDTGKVIRVIGTVQDITERKLAEEKIQENERLFSSLMQYSPIYIYFKDKDLRVLSVSRNFSGLIDIPAEQALGKTMFELFPPQFAQKIIDDDKKILETGEYIKVIEEFNGRTYETIKFPTFKNDKPHMIAGMTIDITDRVNLENEMQKNVRLESLGVLAGGIAHDFNNLLTGIKVYISLISDLAKPHNISKFDSYVREIDNAIACSVSLTKQLLTFSKGGEPLRKTESIEEIIINAANFILRGSNLKCNFNFAKDLFPVEIDAGQIAQVIQNMVINSKQAMPDGGIININVKNFDNAMHEIHMLRTDIKYIQIDICDSGCGIPEHALKKIFDPYFSLKNGSSGLGLAVCYSIIKKHGGLILVSSKEGEGTMFKIYLPANRNKALTPQKAELKNDNVLAGLRILFMDDESIICHAAANLFRRFNAAVEFAPEGEVAIALYKKAFIEKIPFDLVILDLTIAGGMGGKKTIEQLVAFDPHVRAIVMSGYSTDPIMADYNKFGFKAAISKPFDLEMLLEAVAVARADSADR